MKTILLWDPRFPDRKPARLTVDDAVASAAVRSGCATAANPAEAGVLGAGEPLDPTMLTEVVMQQANGTLRRVFLPYSVVMVGASVGIMASIGTPIAGGLAPTPTPSPAFSLAQLPANAIIMDLDPAVTASMTMGTTVGTEVKSWRSSHVGTPPAVTFSQAGVDGLAPRLAPGGWDGNLPCVVSDGANDFLIGDGPYAPRQWNFFVAERAAGNNLNTQTSKNLFTGAESNGGRYGRMATIRSNSNPELNSITFSGLGNSATVTRTGYTIGRRMVLFYDLGRACSIDGVTIGNTTAADVGTATNTTLFGNGATDSCVGMRLARLITIDPSKFHGSYDNRWAMTVISAHLAWTYGTQEGLNANHFFKNRPPKASDFSGFNPSIQTWGNSIGNGTSPGLTSAMFREGLTFAQRGGQLTNGCTGGATPQQIETHFNTGANLGQGLSDNLPVALQRDKMTMFGEMFANPPAAGEDGAIVCMQRMAALVEQAQGVAANGARLLIWTPWSSWSGDIRSASRAKTIADMKALWPNYVYDIVQDFYMLGAPGAAYDDPTNFALGRPPAALKESGGNLHPNDLGYAELRKLVAAWIIARNWDL